MTKHTVDIIKALGMGRRKKSILIVLMPLMLVGQISSAQIGKTSFKDSQNQHSFITPQIRSSDITQQALTIYPDDLALITETRIVDLPAGISEIIFDNVSERAIPETALLRGFSAVRIERNFDTRVLGKGSLLSSNIGKTVKLTRTNPKKGTVSTVRAKIISASKSNGQIDGVVFEINGQYEVLQCSGLSERVQFDESSVLQGRIGAMPTLSLRVRAETAGPQTFVFSYLAKGFSWAADYRVTLKPEMAAIDDDMGLQADLFGWLSVTNNTAKSFKDTELMVVAGTLNKAGALNSTDTQSDSFHANCWPDQTTKTPVPILEYMDLNQDDHMPVQIESLQGLVRQFRKVSNQIVVTGSARAEREVKQEELADYKLYRINERLTMAAYQTKQIRFMLARGLEIEKLYRFDIPVWQITSSAQPVQHAPNLVYEIDNDKDGKLAKPIPKGIMRLFEKSAIGRQIIVGQADIVDTPIGENIRAELGPVHSVMIRSSVQNKVKNGQKQTNSYKINHIISNANDRAITVEMQIPYPRSYMRAYNKSHQFDKTKDPKTWTIIVPANSSQTLRYTLNMN